MTKRNFDIQIRVPEYVASGPLNGAYDHLGAGPGTNFDPVKFISSRFHVSICIGVTAIRSGESITCAKGGGNPDKITHQEKKKKKKKSRTTMVRLAEFASIRVSATYFGKTKGDLSVRLLPKCKGCRESRG